MRIITCAGYYMTGSSAVTDLFNEFSNCGSVRDYEFRFIHDPDGIRDLEYNLIENNNRHNTSNAIKRYLRLAKFLNGNSIRRCYRKYMGNTFYRLSKEFIDSITELQCSTWWHYDQYEKGRLFVYIDNVFCRLMKLLAGKRGRNSVFRYSLLELFNEPAYYSAIDRETFRKCVREYIGKVIKIINKQQTDWVMVDQLLPPSNINSYLNYFDDIRVFVVDRDPRDLFILANEISHEKIIPYYDVEAYCKWYEITRRHRKCEVYDKEKVYFLQFEDLIYQYVETSANLIAFAGLDPKDHTMQYKYLNPAVSVRNTNLAPQYPKYQEEVKYIEERLSDYLYDFSQ